MGKIIDIEQIASKLKSDLILTGKKISGATLASVQIGKAAASEIYIKNQAKLAKQIGVNFLLQELPVTKTEEETIDRIKKINKDTDIDGVIINKPFPEGWKPDRIFAAIAPQKDVEGLNPYNLGRIFYDQLAFISPTVLAVLETIKFADIQLYGKDVTVVGFSTLIGKPLVLLLAKKFATVTVTHIATYEKQKLPFYIKNADLLISAVGKPHFIKTEWIKKGAMVIDVGISKKDSKIVGDVDFKEAAEKVSLISPVPGGVGKLTSLFLFKNLLKAKQYEI